MPNKNDAWGIEVGANAVKAVRLVRTKESIRLADYDVLPFKKILTTPDLNVNEAIQVNLDQFLSRHSVGRATVVVSVPGHTAFARFAKLPPVDPKRIPDIVRFEAVQQIPFPIEQVEWDYQVFQEPDNPDVEVGIFAITKDRVTDFLENYNAVGLTVHGLTLSPLAVYNALVYDLELGPESPGVILMDIGATSTDVIIVEQGHLWLRTLPIGGNNFTDALIRAFKLSFPKAEKLKREAGTSKYARQIFQAMRPVFADLVQEMQRSLGFYQSLNRDAKLTKLVGVGSTFRLPGMAKFLKQQLQIEVGRLDSLERVEMEGKQEAEFAEHSLNMATAYGLALQGLGLERVSANILPHDILRRRFWRAKQPWLGAAAALMVAATGAAGTKLWSQRQAYDGTFAESDRQINETIDRAKRLVSRWNEIENSADPRRRIENLRRVLDYRDVWPKLIADMDQMFQSMNPKEPLLGHDYEKIAEIPRRERNRIYVSKVATKYSIRLPRSVRASAAVKQFKGMSFEDIFGPEGGGGGGPGAAPEPESDVSAEPEEVKKAIFAPTIEVMIEATTPYEGGAKFIVESVVEWLRRNARRPDRPYRIVTESAQLLNVTRVGRDEPAKTAAATPATPLARAVPVAGGEGPGRRALGAAPTPVVSSDSRGGDLVKQLLPARPLVDEPGANQDWRFTVVYTIQLIRPDEARETEREGEAKPGEPAAQVSPAAEQEDRQL